MATFGLDRSFHAVPFQCSMTVRVVLPRGAEDWPTAHASFDEVAVAALSHVIAPAVESCDDFDAFELETPVQTAATRAPASNREASA